MLNHPQQLCLCIERQVRKSAAALLLQGRIGETFDALVTGASAKGTWVRLLHPPVEGRVERVGIWMVVDEGRAIRCQHLLQQSAHEIFEGAVLRSEDFPAYFTALEQNRTIEADDALGSATTGDLRDAYLQPLGITSLLDAPIFREGRVVGVVCHEHVGEQRHWSSVESAFAGSVAAFFSRGRI